MLNEKALEAAAEHYIEGGCFGLDSLRKEICEAIITAYLSAITPDEPRQWQPIETAPRDGIEFLAHDAATKTTHVTYVNSNGYFHDPDNHYYSEAPDFVPTHWMPLPAASAQEDVYGDA